MFAYRVLWGIGLSGHKPRRLLPQTKQGIVRARVDAGEGVVVCVEDPVFPSGARGEVQLQLTGILWVSLFGACMES